MDRYRYALVSPLGTGDDRLGWSRDGKGLPQLLEEGWVPERETPWGDFVLILLRERGDAWHPRDSADTQDVMRST